jgi:hypothetical protein
MLKNYIYIFLISSTLLARNNLPVESGCEAASPACYLADRRVVETPAGVVNGKNGVFTLSRQPADGSRVSLFKTGLPLKEGTDYEVIDRRILLSTIPQLGDVLTAVYSPKSLLESKRSAQTTTSGPVEPVTGGELTQIILRGALDDELGTIGRPQVRALSAERPVSVRILASPSKQLSEQMLLKTTGGFDGLGDSPAISQGSQQLGKRAESNSNEPSRALKMLQDTNQRESTEKAHPAPEKKRR